MEKIKNNLPLVLLIVLGLVFIIWVVRFLSVDETPVPSESDLVSEVADDEKDAEEPLGEASETADQALVDIDWDTPEVYDFLDTNQIDLNYDGSSELFVVYEGEYCNAAGCRFEILQSNEAGWTRLFPGATSSEVRIRRYKVTQDLNQWYRDVILIRDGSLFDPPQADTFEQKIRWNGSAYVLIEGQTTE